MTESANLPGFPRHAIGVLSPVAGSDTLPHGLYRLLGPDYIVISTSLALQSFKSDDLERAVAAIDKLRSRHEPSRVLHARWLMRDWRSRISRPKEGALIRATILHLAQMGGPHHGLE